MIVDDENFNLSAIQLILNRIYKNLDIVTAKDGEEGLDTFTKHNFVVKHRSNDIKLILTDL